MKRDRPTRVPFSGAQSHTVIDDETLRTLETEYEVLFAKSREILMRATSSRRSVGDVCAEQPDGPLVVPEKSDPTVPCRVEYLAGSSRVIRERFVPTLETIVSNIMGEPYTLFKDKCNIKMPGGSGFGPHQDMAAYRHFPATFYVTVAVWLDDATLKNGCLEIADNYRSLDLTSSMIETRVGSYPLFPFYQGGVNNGDIQKGIASRFLWRPVITRYGDLTLFDCFLPHRSLTNSSSSSRRAMFFTFNATAEGTLYEDYYIRKRKDFGNSIFHISTPTTHDRIDLPTCVVKVGDN